MNKIDLKELAEYMADVESRKSCSEKATELFETRGKDFCVGLILHAEIMCISRQGGGRSCTYILSACRERGERMPEIKLMSIDDAIYVQLWTNGAWRHKICGQVVGSYEGMVGLLLDNGEYVDVPQERLRILETEEEKIE